MTRRIAFVGPLPPPVHGFSTVCAAMLELLKSRSAVEVFDRAPRGRTPYLTALRHLRGAGRFLLISLKDPRADVYLALSGGFGQIYDSWYAGMARLQRRRLFIHHHSFAYVNRPTRLSRLFFGLARHQTHLVLSAGMGESLARTYRLDPGKVKVLSNAAFFTAPAGAPRSDRPPAAPIRLGFISNITVEKGFVEFFGVLSELARHNVAYRAVIAGPVDPAAQTLFSELVAASDHTTAAGPLYGEAKDRFFENLDLLLFPTKYANEAEPLVIHEALRHGVPVLACERGAIAEILRNGAGEAFPADRFISEAVSRIRGLAANPAALSAAREAALREARRIGQEGAATLEAILDDLTRSGD